MRKALGSNPSVSSLYFAHASGHGADETMWCIWFGYGARTQLTCVREPAEGGAVGVLFFSRALEEPLVAALLPEHSEISLSLSLSVCVPALTHARFQTHTAEKKRT